MHDALFTNVLGEADGISLDDALVRGRDAALAGAAATAGMIASIGRAARLGEQSRGTPDAGATSFAMIVRAAVDTYLAAAREQTSGTAR